ncbi:MAG: ATP synthase F1 subunit epsilon [Lachnospiraceae bacterium]|nr:ATP synthase F1 subunit epsilon [Lachnospiraceae bacterium]
MADEKNFRLKVITPERVFYEGDVRMVEFNTTEGEIGIYRGHVPMTVIVSPGILVISEEESPRNAALHAGFAEILQDRVTILAEVIEWPDEIDRKRAEDAKARAQERLDAKAEETDILRAEAALRRALTRIHVIS